ncbi:DUF3102 domain-containing protein [Leptospira sp. GIMC2001]|uniref:DUF3102 domain-containing protein n=1 Tax=Leptospira sp. GIMC2001 TaxID=1513297 RepID=UPI00234B6232|nr:DUF3102 domain-containing protein [Leptospira sp. GIMC2001]WCL51480.1 DUF3102 domain-containing protein [Leptospira sp. GIMC2001]
MSKKDKRLQALSGIRPGAESDINKIVEKDIDPDISKAIALHESIAINLKNAVRTAISLGELLAGKKSNLPHGQFTNWVETNLPFTMRTAQRYMSLYDFREKLNTTGLSLLEDAYKYIADQKEQKELPGESPKLLYQRWKMGGSISKKEREIVKDLLETNYHSTQKKLEKIKSELDSL